LLEELVAPVAVVLLPVPEDVFVVEDPVVGTVLLVLVLSIFVANVALPVMAPRPSEPVAVK